MSGGGFNYLFVRMSDPSKGMSALSDLGMMKEHCEVYPEAIPYLQGMIDLINMQATAYLELGQKIAPLLRAIEWEASSDGDSEGIVWELEALKSPNGRHPDGEPES